MPDLNQLKIFRFIRLLGMVTFLTYYILRIELSPFPALLYILTIFTGATLVHEISHCAVARIWTKNCEIDWNISWKPGTANYREPLEIPPDKFKYVGAAPLLFNFIGIAIALSLNFG